MVKNIANEQKSNQLHSFNLLFVKKKVCLLNHVITSVFLFLKFGTISRIRTFALCFS